MTWVWLLVAFGALAWIASGRSRYTIDELVPKRGLLVLPLVPAGETASPSAEWVVNCLRRELNLEVEFREQPMSIDRSLFQNARQQGDAVAIVELLEQLVRPDCAVLGVIDCDLHSSLRRDLPYAMGARKGWAGLISTYRMEDKLRPDNTLERLRKMAVRYGAELVCDAPRNHDPQSVHYESLHRAEQLDIMQWGPVERV